MATFVLVHGAWHGAWCWRRVGRLLIRAGHDVFAPTLTGLCERSHLLTPAVDLDTHALVDRLQQKQLTRPGLLMPFVSRCRESFTNVNFADRYHGAMLEGDVT
jgi:hypothetical protein